MIFHSDLIKEFLSDYQFKEHKPEVSKMNSVNSELPQKYDVLDRHNYVDRNGIEGGVKANEQTSYDNKGFVSDTGEKSRVVSINSNITSTKGSGDQQQITPGFTELDSHQSVNELDEKNVPTIGNNGEKTRKRHTDVKNTEEQKQQQTKENDNNFVTTISVISSERL